MVETEVNRPILQTCQKAANALPTLFQNWQSPEFFIQFGPGFLTDNFFDAQPQTAPLSALPELPEHPTPDNITPELQFGTVHHKPVLALAGHRHLAEALGTAPCLIPIAAASLCGCRKAILISSCISLQQEFKIGNWALLTDYINWHHVSPLDGMAPLLTEPYPDMTIALSQELNSEIVNSLDNIGITPKLVTFLSNPGFHACTQAEANFLRLVGADCLGHDLVMEIITAHALNCQVSALVLAVGQMLPGMTSRIQRNDMLETCAYCSPQLLRGLRLALK